MKTIVVGLLLVGSATLVRAGGINAATDVPYPVQWSQPQVQNGVVVPGVPTRFQTRSVGVTLHPQAVVRVTPGSPSPVVTSNVLALIAAANRGDLASVKALLAKGADVNSANQNGATALMAAAAGGSVEIVTLLVEKGADLNAATTQGKTALMYAAEKGKAKIVQLLLGKGADRRVLDEAGKMAIDYAVAGKFKECVELLKEKTTAK